MKKQTERQRAVALVILSERRGELDIDPEACPGRGCVPGDGVTANCNDDEGCGYSRKISN